MSIQLKPLNQQVMVITGATSGIGLVTARTAAEEGVKLVLTARSQEALQQLEVEITSRGGQAVAVAGDVANDADVRKVAAAAIERFGGFDTWVNNAGVSVYGRLDEVPLADFRRLFETNFWGTVNGTLIAVEHLRTRGGTLINIGSVLSDRAIPLQGMYCASKFAVKGFTEALRMEIEERGDPISVTLIKPSAIDTPYKRHAKNYLEVDPQNPPPVYAPEVVAEAILHAAVKPMRDIIVGGGGRALSAMAHVAPRLTDRVMERAFFKGQKSTRPARDREDHSLYEPKDDLHERGDYDGHVMESSVYTKAALHPVMAGAAVVAAAGLAVAALLRKRK